jgi:DNA-binding NtrC family response regulator
MVADKTFREDLFYRLNVLPIRLPPLRDRQEDVPALLDFFLARYRSSARRGPVHISVAARQQLSDYAWPGNVRELKNLVERLVVTVDDDTIREHHLPDEIRRRSPQPAAGVPQTNEQLKEMKRTTHERAIGELEKRFILDALSRNDWNISRAARDTGMLRPNFHALMRKHNVRAS